MKITICDDEPEHLALIGGYAAEYRYDNNLEIEIMKFSSPTELLSYENQDGGGDIYLLDIVMSEISGIELGMKIREYGKRAAIIFLTSARDYSLEAFSVHAFSYLLKPIDKERLFEELDKCLRYYLPPQKERITLTVKTAEGLTAVPAKNVNAVEYLNHRLVYHLTDGNKIEGVYRKSSFDLQLRECIPEELFIKCANCFIVNTDNIFTATPRGFKMKNGEEIPITRKYADAKIKFLNAKIKSNT